MQKLSFRLLSFTRVFMFFLLGSVYYYFCKENELFLKIFTAIATLIFILNHFLLSFTTLDRFKMWFFSLDLFLTFLFGIFFAGKIGLYFIMFGVLAVTLFIMTDNKKVLKFYIYTFFLLYGIILYISYTKTHQLDLVYNLIDFMFIFFGAVVGRLIRRLQVAQEKVTSQYEQLQCSHQELSNVYEQLKLYSKQVEDLTVIRERNQIAREIHDTVGHKMTALLVQLQLSRELMKLDSNKSKEAIQNCEGLARNALEDIRTSVRTLHEEDENISLLASLQSLLNNFSKATQTEVTLQVNGDLSTIPTSLQPTITRVIQEALTNSNRHGHASKCEVNMDCKLDSINLLIKDNGRGIAQIEPSFGLINMRERVLEHGGTIKYVSEENKGFAIDVIFPLKQWHWSTGGIK